jgi:hypothetical protein
MRRVLIILFSWFAFIFAKAQVFSVGDSSCNYVRVDSVLRCYQIGMGTWSMTKTYSIDLDADLVNDITIVNAHNGSSPGSSSHHNGVLTCTSNTSVEFVRNPTLTCSGNVSSNLGYGSGITSSLNWNTSVANSLVYNFSIYYWGTSSFCGNIFPFTINQPTNIYIGFRKILPGDTIYGWINLITISDGTDKVVSYAYRHTASNPTVTPAFTTSQSGVLCAGNPFTLTANPPGGTFYGPGVTGNVFNSGINGGGNYTVYYNKNCGTAAMNLSVTAAPVLAFTNSVSSLCYGDSLTLTASPSGGFFSGTGVSGNMFYSSAAGLGSETVNYSYTDANGCSNTKTNTINVISTTTLNITSTSTMSCPGNTVGLSVSGASTYTWNTGANTSNIVVSPTTTTVYTVLGQASSGTCPLTTASFTQAASDPTVSIGFSGGPICNGQTHSLYAFGNANSYLWSTGSGSIVINVTPSVTTTYSLTGTNPGGCYGTAAIEVTVVPNSTITAVANHSISCKGDTIIITLAGSSQYHISAFDLSINVTSSTVALTPTTSITYTIFSTAPYNCAPTVYLQHYVWQCVGINELIHQESQLQIFPNPSNGELEIKGIKEETIFISNELGQLISTKYLNPENNYSVKLNDLQNGVYFVGNKFSRQKVVVIK